MDWSRAKNIILIVLILLNIFLFFNVMNVKSSYNVTQQYQRNAKQALEAAGIIVTGRIPNNNEPMSRISYVEKDLPEYNKIVNSLIQIDYNKAADTENPFWEKEGRKLEFSADKFIYTDKTGMTNFNIDDEKKLNRQLLSWIQDNDLSSINFIHKSLIKDGDSVTVEYIQEYNKTPLFSNRIIFTIENKMLTRVECSKRVLYNIKLSKQKDEIISPNIILLTGRNKIQGVISAIVLGYIRPKGEELYDIPVWQINFHSGDEMFFNAFTGEWIESLQ